MIWITKRCCWLGSPCHFFGALVDTRIGFSPASVLSRSYLLTSLGHWSWHPSLMQTVPQGLQCIYQKQLCSARVSRKHYWKADMNPLFWLHRVKKLPSLFRDVAEISLVAINTNQTTQECTSPAATVPITWIALVDFSQLFGPTSCLVSGGVLVAVLNFFNNKCQRPRYFSRGHCSLHHL